MAGNQAIRRYRKAQGLTQKELGAELGVSNITVYRWESGDREIDPKLVPSISEKTGIPKRELRPDLVELLGAG